LRVKAVKVEEEIFETLKSLEISCLGSSKQLCNTSVDELINLQGRDFGKGKSNQYSRDHKKLIKRPEEGIRAYFGRRDISKINNKDVRTYFIFFNSRRNVPLASSTRKKYTSVTSKRLDFLIRNNQTQ